MLPTQLVLCVRRLSWMASMLKDVEPSTCLFAAAFSSLDFEEGSGVPRTNPWEKMFSSDLTQLRHIEGSQVISEFVSTIYNGFA